MEPLATIGLSPWLSSGQVVMDAARLILLWQPEDRATASQIANKLQQAIAVTRHPACGSHSSASTCTSTSTRLDAGTIAISHQESFMQYTSANPKASKAQEASAHIHSKVMKTWLKEKPKAKTPCSCTSSESCRSTAHKRGKPCTAEALPGQQLCLQCACQVEGCLRSQFRGHGFFHSHMHFAFTPSLQLIWHLGQAGILARITPLDLTSLEELQSTMLKAHKQFDPVLAFVAAWCKHKVALDSMAFVFVNVSPNASATTLLKAFHAVLRDMSGKGTSEAWHCVSGGRGTGLFTAMKKLQIAQKVGPERTTGEVVTNIGPSGTSMELLSTSSVLATLVTILRSGHQHRSTDLAQENKEYCHKLEILSAKHPELGLNGKYVGPLLRLKHLLISKFAGTRLSIKALLDLELPDVKDNLSCLPHDVFYRPDRLFSKFQCHELLICTFACLAGPCLARYPDACSLLREPSGKSALQASLDRYLTVHQHAPSMKRLLMFHLGEDGVADADVSDRD